LRLSSAFPTAIPNPAQSRSSRSFSPSPNAIVRSRREADVLGDEREAASLRDRRARELEEVRQRLGDVETIAEPLLQTGPELVEPRGSSTTTSFVGGRSIQPSRSPTSCSGMLWKSA
jgi:hypothetical protein